MNIGATKAFGESLCKLPESTDFWNIVVIPEASSAEQADSTALDVLMLLKTFLEPSSLIVSGVMRVSTY